MSALEVFRDDEMEVLLCGAGEHWTPQQLADSMKFDHGYTAQSTPVRCATEAWHGRHDPCSWLR
jgi:E3 ubiquitin-protein ligase TRIP12